MIDTTNLKELTIEEHKQIALNILLEVADFCEKNNFRYFLAYGTLIGAIRHKGFIPWDDDIDIQMPRPDYERFAKEFNKEYADKNLLAIMPSDKNAKHTYMKICDMNTVKIENGIRYHSIDETLGVDIDVFPLDGQYENDDRYKKAFNDKKKLYVKYFQIECKFFMNDLKFNLSSFLTLIKRFGGILQGKLLTNFSRTWKKEYLLNEMHKKEVEIPYDSAVMVGTNCSKYDTFNDRHLKTYYDTYIPVTFEGHTFRAPVGYDAILTKQYGDYMTPPPRKMQETHHGSKVYMK